MKAVSLALVAAAGLLPALGFSAQVTYTTSTEALASGSPALLSFTQFDSSIGTLSGVDISFHYEIADFSYTFSTTNYPATVGEQFNASLTNLSGANGNTTITNSLSGINLAAARITQGDWMTTYSIPAGKSYVFDYTALQNAAVGPIDMAYWNAYVGSGTVQVNSTANYGLLQSIQGSDVVQTGSVGAGSIYGTITYTFTAIPEPATYALILGACTLGFIGWRRFRK